jgi:hypothetical protein
VDPEDALSVSAQIAVAVAGFAGVAASFGSEPIHAWSRVDRMRLRFLLFGAALPLVLSLLGLVVLTIDIGTALAFAWCSAVALLVDGSWQVHALRAVLGTPKVELRRAGWNTPIFWGMWSPVSALAILQAYNAVVLHEFWPFYALIVVQLGSVTVQFIRLILYRGVTID